MKSFKIRAIGLPIFCIHVLLIQSHAQDPIVAGVHTLSIHVQDTVTHDSVYQFLNKELGLPVYYTPEVYGIRRYVGLYAGNMVLEPCGPYPENDYAIDNFRAIFFGVNFESFKSLSAGEEKLRDLEMKQQVNPNSIYIRDTMLCSENLFAALYMVRDQAKRDSLRDTMCGGAGIEYINEIRLGYKEELNLRRWEEFMHPLQIGEDGYCQVNDSLQFHFSRAAFNQVKGITFKVRSLKQTRQYLEENHLLESGTGTQLKIDPICSFGLNVNFTDDGCGENAKF